ncbi:MAG: TAT-variant-translocated molybdopterin oxidoreductase [Bacteroidetes bacterium]|nr:TAT-variant-translocated molybdopterin oxidoreductase [Bacteroidota bacterium]
MSNHIKYWKGEEELVKDPSFLAVQKNEFPEALPLDEVLSEDGFELNSNRRDFLKYFGFSVTAVALAACYRTPVRKAVPYLVKPEDVTPGVANYYSSTCGSCSVGCGVEVKVREGRPIKIDGSPRSSISKGGLCAQGQAGILSLYDTERLANPTKNGAEVTDWAKLDSEISAALKSMADGGQRIVVLSNTVHSPSALRAVEDFKKAFTTAEHVTYDAISYSGILQANKKDFGKSAIPSYKFDKAELIVSFGADFLGTWISPVEFTKDYTTNRIPTAGREMSKHIQFESTLSLTGTNADDRYPIKAGKEGLYLASLYNAVAQETGGKPMPVAQNMEVAGNGIAKTAKLLAAAKGKSLVISGSSDMAVQCVVNGINMMLENYGKTIDLTNHSNQYKGTDSDEEAVLNDLSAGKIAGIIFWGTNPVYNSNGKRWEEAIKKARLSVSFSLTKDETATHCTYVCPDNHYLESWGDAEPKAGVYHFVQPTISNVFNTRQAPLSLLTWAGALPQREADPFDGKGNNGQKFNTSLYYSYMKDTWKGMLGEGDLDEKFNKCLHDGVWSAEAKEAAAPAYEGNIAEVASAVEAGAKGDGVDLVLYESVGVRDGAHGNNPWLHEMPDPVSKVTWDNYIALPKALAVKLGVGEGDTVNLKAGSLSLSNIPALIQPGQANNTVGIALGYGRTAAGKVGGSKEKNYDSIGFNLYPAMTVSGGSRQRVVKNVELTKGDETYRLAQTQTHHSIEGRDLVRESTFSAWKKAPNAGNDKPKTHVYTIWEKRDYLKDGQPNHRWAMAVDLNACTGCGACVVSCSIENNVPVVGRDEILKRREMHWIRIDRYYAWANPGKEVEGNYITREKEMKKVDASDKGNYEHWEHVKVVHQPMMCQHCSQAPCESVCPVLATTHSSEGLNQMTYNRCIGTKYCGNNCPYKVRRFNWFRYNDNDHFDFHFNNPLGKMVINPDVTVRTRGVMEKCSFCVQRIQEGKLKAKREGRAVTDGEVKTACQRTCPANAIVFGDLHDKNSEVSKLYRNERGFQVLEELNVQSSVMYLTKIRNTENV